MLERLKIIDYVLINSFRNYKLLSFGEEAEEDELETLEEAKKYEGKSKSTHDVLNDPKLSSQTLLDVLNSEDEERNEKEEKRKDELA